jgi:hypothetical protein
MNRIENLAKNEKIRILHSYMHFTSVRYKDEKEELESPGGRN